ncbi:hypothetical protein [Spirosoma sp. KUDC1026]|uniref:hypothetical protein n=1 Tax=Spirosoma sp. KUDC1026 TaxID=2745947 RepID=UPI00159BC204|nr:hypothetical protein [Spirosoma sp. KUDC1026]QKZ12404.1 hypothetical protein HU175_07105 [Spirosoma sp. KUDC1026]
MVQVTKQAVQQWMLLDYLAQKHRFQENVRLFERKYDMPFDAFEKYVASAPKELINEWDDYVEWKADNEFLHMTEQKIRDVQAGNIEYIG